MTGKTRALTVLIVLLFVSLICAAAALAEDAETLRLLPGTWSNADEVQKSGEEQEAAIEMTFGSDGSLTLRCGAVSGKAGYTCTGIWLFERAADGSDRLTLRFTQTTNPEKAGQDYYAEGVYLAHTETWVENTMEYRALIMDVISANGVSPFEEIYGYDGAALYQKKGPNMKVVNCDSFVSLRSERSKTSARVAKVPLGAMVLAYPEMGEENGFIACYYQNYFGDILKEYLAAAR